MIRPLVFFLFKKKITLIAFHLKMFFFLNSQNDDFESENYLIIAKKTKLNLQFNQP
jgi:hypothetical protein